MNKLLIAVLLTVAGVLCYTKFVHDPVPVPEGPENVNPLLQGVTEQPTAPEMPTLKAKVFAEDFHDRGQWRGNPAVGDLNGDGHLDLVTSLRRWDRKTMGDGVFVYLGDGKLGFQEQINGLERKLGYGGAALLDMNADGKLDMAYSGHDQTPRIYVNFLDEKENPTWIGATPEGVDTGAICSDVALGDFDQDGHADLITLGQFPREGGLQLWRGDGTGAVTGEKFEIKDKENFGSRVELVDMDGDGNLDLATALDIGSRVFKWDPATKTAVDMFADKPDQKILGADLAIDSYDFDGDGRRELIVAGYMYEGHDPIRVFKFDGEKWNLWGEGLPKGESFFDVKVGQLEENGPPILFCGGQWGIVIIEMHEVGKFRPMGRLEDSAKIFNLGAGDFNGDGKDEVVWIGEGGVRVYEIELPSN